MEAPSAQVLVGEMNAITAVVVQKEESFQETVVTAVTTTAVNTIAERMDVEEKEEAESDQIIEREKKEKLEKEVIATEMEEEEENVEEEEEGQAEKLMRRWESEVRTFLSFLQCWTVNIIHPKLNIQLQNKQITGSADKQFNKGSRETSRCR